MKKTNILLVDCNQREGSADVLEEMLAASSLEGTLRQEVVTDLSQTTFDWDWLEDENFDSCLVFLILPRHEPTRGGALIQFIKKKKPAFPIIVVVEDCGSAETLEFLQKGASDFITPPLRAADTLPRTWRLLDQLHSREDSLRSLRDRVGLKLVIGKTASFLAEINKIPLIARSDIRVLITGETGTGKEMYARAIHYLSPRAGKSFVPVNCGAIPADLVENELFGHEHGAFTGATRAQAGLIEEAEGGTLFLDEIDCLPLMAQVKLLRFLQEKEYRRLGSSKARNADVRMIVASNAVLEEAVQKGRMRQDLYFRLNVVSIALPPLRERREDVSALAHHFLAKYAANHEEVKTLSPDAIQKLTLYDWPGNVRELENTIERAVTFCSTSRLTECDIVLPVETRRPRESFQQAKARIVERFERDYVQRLLLACDGNISRAAQAARKNRRAFWELIRKHHVDVRNFKPNA